MKTSPCTQRRPWRCRHRRPVPANTNRASCCCTDRPTSAPSADCWWRKPRACWSTSVSKLTSSTRPACRGLLLLALLALLLAALAWDLLSGPSGLRPATLLQGLLHPRQLELGQRVIIWNVRLPYALMALLVGAALALAGAEM